MYNHSACDQDTFAFVFPSGSDGVPELQGSFRKNQKGQYVIYVCPLTVYAESMGLLAEAVQTMVTWQMDADGTLQLHNASLGHRKFNEKAVNIC